jgi:hypothetical protein
MTYPRWYLDLSEELANGRVHCPGPADTRHLSRPCANSFLEKIWM